MGHRPPPTAFPSKHLFCCLTRSSVALLFLTDVMADVFALPPRSPRARPSCTPSGGSSVPVHTRRILLPGLATNCRYRHTGALCETVRLSQSGNKWPGPAAGDQELHPAAAVRNGVQRGVRGPRVSGARERGGCQRRLADVNVGARVTRARARGADQDGVQRSVQRSTRCQVI
jgi:hypothetical protein